MHPLDLLKVKFQIATSKPQGGLGRQIYTSLRDIYHSRGIQGLYRGVGPNIAGNASSWGFYFLLFVRTVQLHMQYLTRILATPRSSAVPLVVIPTTKCRQAPSCYVQQKRVRDTS